MRRRVIWVLAAVSLAAACSSGGAIPRQAGASDPTRNSSEAAAPVASPRPTPDADAAPTPTGSTTTSSRDAETASPTSPPSFRELAMDVSVTPACVALGSTAELRVTSDHGVQVVWGAVYDGGEGGADPPFGSGHGGTGSGIIGEERTYVARWTVRPSAPTGPAIVIVQAGHGDRYGYREVPFEVVAAAARC